jgi:hypothetical protein
VRNVRRHTIPFITLSALAAAFAAPVTVWHGGADAATGQTSTNRQLIRIGAPSPTPSPKPAIVIGKRPSQTNSPTPAQTNPNKPGRTVQGTVGPARQGATGIVVRPGGGGNIFKSPAPGGSAPWRVVETKAPSISIGPDRFEAPRGEKPIKYQPFTIEELKVVAPKERITQRPDGTYWIKYWKKNLETGKKEKEDYVRIEDYVKQLNQYELLVNKAGCTLRKGPLAAGAAASVSGSQPGRIGMKQGQIQPSGPIIKRRSPLDNISRCGVLFRIKSRRPPPGLTELVVYHDPNLLFRKGNPFERPEVIRGQAVNRATGLTRMNPLFGVKTRRVPLAGGLPGQYRTEDTSSAECDIGNNNKDSDIGRNPICPDPTGKNCPTASAGGGEEHETGEACGTKDANNKLKCLYSGKLAAEWPAAFSTCVHASSGGNGWFDAALCADSNFMGQGQAGPTQFMKLDNDASVHLDVSLLGSEPMHILNIASAANYDSLGGETQSRSPALSIFGGEPLSVADYDKTIRFVGPQALIFIGPVPITLRTGLDASFGLAGAATPSAAIPVSCDVGGQGKFGLGFQVKAGAGVWAEAVLDAYVASAGVRAELVLTDDRLRLFMNTEVRPSTNDIVVSTGYDYDAVHLKGVVSAFVDVDLLVYEERFDIELFSFGGYSSHYPKAGQESQWSVTFGASDAMIKGL